MFRSRTRPEGSSTRAALEQRPLYSDESVPFLLAWSQKAGCTTLLTWFLAHSGDLEEAASYGRWVHDWEREVLTARPDYLDEASRRLDAGVPVFKLVRSPYTRAVSSYMTVLAKPDGVFHDTNSVRASVRKMVYGTDDVPYSFSFRQFVRWMATQDVWSLDGHLSPQSTQLDDLFDVRYIRLEHLAADLSKLETEFGLQHVDLASLPKPDHHVERSVHRFDDASAVADMQPFIPLEFGAPQPRPEDFLAEDVVSEISTIFATDIARFGYIV